MLLSKINEVWCQLQYLPANQGQIFLPTEIVKTMVVDGDSKCDSRSDNEGEKGKSTKKTS